MKCTPCAQETQRKFNTEIAIHLPGRKGLEQPAVFVFVEMSICTKCGKAELSVPESPANPAQFNQVPPTNFDGVFGKNLSNRRTNGLIVPVGKGKDVTAPFPDPGEPFQDVYAQIYGQQTLFANAIAKEPPRLCNVQGFVYNYSLKNPADLANADSHHELSDPGHCSGDF